MVFTNVVTGAAVVLVVVVVVVVAGGSIPTERYKIVFFSTTFNLNHSNQCRKFLKDLRDISSFNAMRHNQPE